MKLFKKTMVLSVVLVLCNFAMADVVTLTGDQDVSIWGSFNSAQNHCYWLYPEVHFGSDSRVPTNWSAFLQFENLPTDAASVENATLRMYCSVYNWNGGAGPGTYYVGQVTTGWGSGVDPMPEPSAPRLATDVVGFGGPYGSDFGPWPMNPAVGYADVYSNTEDWVYWTCTGLGWYEIDVTAIVNDWLVNGEDNYGFHFAGQAVGGNVDNDAISGFDVINASTGGNPLQLVIDYTVPEPATMSLLGLGGLVAFIRRKK